MGHKSAIFSEQPKFNFQSIWMKLLAHVLVKMLAIIDENFRKLSALVQKMWFFNELVQLACIIHYEIKISITPDGDKKYFFY